MIKKILKVTAGIVLAAVVLLTPAKAVKADAVTDAILAQQAALYEQQLAAIQAYQVALAAQYQQQVADQYAKAVLVFNEAQANQQRAIQQAYMLKAIQQQQKAQYECMIKSTGLDYQQHLLEDYTRYQQKGIDAFKGYEGIK